MVCDLPFNEAIVFQHYEYASDLNVPLVGACVEDRHIADALLTVDKCDSFVQSGFLVQ